MVDDLLLGELGVDIETAVLKKNYFKIVKCNHRNKIHLFNWEFKEEIALTFIQINLLLKNKHLLYR